VAIAPSLRVLEPPVARRPGLSPLEHLTRFLFARTSTSNVIGNLFPAYASYKAVLSKNPKAHKQWLMYWYVVFVRLRRRISPHDSGCASRVLRIVNTFFIVFEMFGDALVSWCACRVDVALPGWSDLGSWLCRVPLYYEAKIVFIVWLTLPQFQVRATCSWLHFVRGCPMVLIAGVVHQGATVMYKKFIEPALENYEKDIDSGISAAGERVSHHVRQISDASATFLRTQGAAVLRKVHTRGRLMCLRRTWLNL